MNREISGTNLHARAAATQPPSLRAARSRTRRRLHDPRPSVTSETRKRIGQWKTQVKEAAKARQIRAVDRLYADELLAFPSVARGHYSLASDATMGQRLDVSDSTARRQRRRLDKAGLVEVLGYGRDGNSCLVRPILRDGTPVFPDPEMPSRLATSDHPPRSDLTADSFLQTPKTEEPPLPPAPDTAEEGGRAFELTENKPADPVEVQSTAKPDENSVEPAKVELASMTFLAFWLAIGQTGREGYARAQWGKLTAADKAAIQDRLGRPRSWAADMWAGTWLKGRCWDEAVPAAARPEQVFIRENTPEWRCWQRHLGRSMPVNSQGGWWFSSRLPPLEWRGTPV
jgi:hypothetical protein